MRYEYWEPQDSRPPLLFSQPRTRFKNLTTITPEQRRVNNGIILPSGPAIYKQSGARREKLSISTARLAESLTQLQPRTNPNNLEAAGWSRPRVPAPLREESAKQNRSRLRRMRALISPDRWLPQPHKTSR